MAIAMPEPEPALPEPELPRALVIALMQAAERAVSTINTALTIQFCQPAQPPSDAEAFRQQLIVLAATPVNALWNALEATDLRMSGRHLFLALLRELIDTSSAGLAKIRQFQSPPPPAEAASPAPGSTT